MTTTPDPDYFIGVPGEPLALAEPAGGSTVHIKGRPPQREWDVTFRRISPSQAAMLHELLMLGAQLEWVDPAANCEVVRVVLTHIRESEQVVDTTPATETLTFTLIEVG